MPRNAVIHTVVHKVIHNNIHRPVHYHSRPSSAPGSSARGRSASRQCSEAGRTTTQRQPGQRQNRGPHADLDHRQKVSIYARRVHQSRLNRWRRPAAVASTPSIPAGQSRWLRMGERLCSPHVPGPERVSQKNTSFTMCHRPLRRSVAIAGPNGPEEEEPSAASRKRSTPAQSSMNSHRYLDSPHSASAAAGFRSARGQRPAQIHAPIHVSSTCPWPPEGRTFRGAALGRLMIHTAAAL